jgi:CheY-like chemotaxis protein
MEARKFWNVLIVDDEPDVHELTDYTLRRERILGVPLKLHHAHSAAEARTFFETNDAAMSLAVAFIDVVMETDDAGLQLCRWIREDRCEHVTQLLLRTGQPGKAPPRQVIDEYDVSGYLHKVEATEGRLYLALKTAVQHYYDLQYLFRLTEFYDAVRDLSSSPRQLYDRLKAIFAQPFPEAYGVEAHWAMACGDVYLGRGRYVERAEYDRIEEDVFRRGAAALGRQGIARVDNHVLLQTALFSGQVARLLVTDATFPRELHELYGPVWRQNLAYLGEILSRL